MSEICGTCLSTDRNLVPIENLTEHLKIWDDITLPISQGLCWECSALFKRMSKFKLQVIEAQDILKHHKSKIIPLSSLTNSSTMIDYNSVYVEERDIKVEPQELNSDENTITNVIIKVEEQTPEYTTENESDSNQDLQEKREDIESDKEQIDNVIKTEEYLLESEDDDDNLIKEINSDEFNIEIESFGNPLDVEGTEMNDADSYEIQRMIKNLDIVLTKREKMYKIKFISEDELVKLRHDERNAVRYKNGDYKCDTCIMSYSNEQLYIRHNAKKHSTKSSYHKCDICKTMLPTKKIHKAHFIRHYMKFQCKVCQFEGHKLSCMIEHTALKHGGGRLFYCKVCNGGFSTRKKLRYHRLKEHTELLSCDTCGKKCVTKDALLSHNACHVTVPLYHCPLCEKVFKSKMGLNVHMRSHNPARTSDAYCHDCSMQFRDISTYRRHLRNHSRHKHSPRSKYECKECGFNFTHKTDYTRHFNSKHYKNMEHSCHICQKKFVRKDRMEKHILYDHEGVPKPRNYVCPHCEKAFTSHTVLSNHVRTHTGERPYKCKLCGSSFVQRAGLLKHTRSLHKEKQPAATIDNTV